jgi:SulP family sulfate permease
LGGRWAPRYEPRALWLDVRGGLASSVVTLPLSLGLANLACSLFGGVPASVGLMPRTAALRSSPETPVAGIVHAIALAGVPLALGAALGLVPVPVLGGVVLAHILMTACWGKTREMLRRSRAEASAWVVSVVAFAALDISTAVLVTMLLSAFVASRARSHERVWGAHSQPYRVH